MTVTEPYFDMHSDTQRQLEAYQFATQSGFIIAKDPASRRITVSGLVTDRMQHDAVSTKNGVEDAFRNHFAPIQGQQNPDDITVSITDTPRGRPDSFHATLTGKAYDDFIAGEAAEHEYGTLERKPEFLRTVMLRHAYDRINKPDYTLTELPGLNGGTITISGPVNPRIQCGMKTHFAELFGSEGLEVDYTRHAPQHFTARFTGAAYTRLKAAQAAHEAVEPAAIGH